jgi:hypothetical protein
MFLSPALIKTNNKTGENENKDRRRRRRKNKLITLHVEEV